MDAVKLITVVFTDQMGPIVNNALDLKWTHVLIRFSAGPYYEATWPRVRTAESFKSVDHDVFMFYVPDEVHDKAREYAESMLGHRYSFWGYFFPRLYGKTYGIYCSQYVCEALRAGGVPLPKGAGWSPDKLLKALKTYIPEKDRLDF